MTVLFLLKTEQKKQNANTKIYTEQRNYVQSIKIGESLNESQGMKISLPPVEFAYRSLRVVAGRWIPK